MKSILIAIELPRDPPRGDAKRADCVEDTEELDPELIAVVYVIGEAAPDGWHPIIGCAPIIAPCQRFHLLIAAIPSQQARCPQIPNKGPRRVGAARKTVDEDFVAGLVP